MRPFSRCSIISRSCFQLNGLLLNSDKGCEKTPFYVSKRWSIRINPFFDTSILDLPFEIFMNLQAVLVKHKFWG